ncbi:hypothetical protein D3C71_1764400 [compost metagenome]
MHQPERITGVLPGDARRQFDEHSAEQQYAQHQPQPCQAPRRPSGGKPDTVLGQGPLPARAQDHAIALADIQCEVLPTTETLGRQPLRRQLHAVVAAQ